MNKFGLLDPDEASSPQASKDLSQRLAEFPIVRPRAPIDLPAIDAAAAQHGFTSREGEPAGFQAGRRRRAIPAEPTRHLAIRLPASAYARFVAYADQHRLTYHDALIRMMDEAESAMPTR